MNCETFECNQLSVAGSRYLGFDSASSGTFSPCLHGVLIGVVSSTGCKFVAFPGDFIPGPLRYDSPSFEVGMPNWAEKEVQLGGRIEGCWRERGLGHV